jgi:hypothetical protein
MYFLITSIFNKFYNYKSFILLIIIISYLIYIKYFIIINGKELAKINVL